MIYQGDLVGARIRSDFAPGVEFELEQRLGEGGTATAYLGTRHSPDGMIPTVVKVMLPALVAQAHEVASLIAHKEIESLRRLSSSVPPNPFVVRLYDAGRLAYGTSGGTLELPWLALECVHGAAEGTTLEERVSHSVRVTGHAFGCARVSRLLEHVCAGLTEVHLVGIIHRDLTPNNVLCCGAGDTEMFKISDFGIARPAGMVGTFGADVLGTPGYIPPEQLGEGELTPASDIFALGALTYRALAGEDYFTARTPMDALRQAQSTARRSVSQSPYLAPDLVRDPALCSELDGILARATACDPTLRPATARSFAAALVPLLNAQAAVEPARISDRAPTMVSPLTTGERWLVRHPPGDDRAISCVGWDGDGSCLAATSRGLEVWDGSAWQLAPSHGVPMPQGVRFVLRTGPARWLIGGERATFAEFGGRGALRVVRPPERTSCLTAASGSPDNLCVFVAHTEEGDIGLLSLVGGYWLKPLPIPDASCVASLSRLDDERWLVAGRTRAGHGFVSLFLPLRWEIYSLPVKETRAYVAASGQFEIGVAIAVGSEGAVVEVEGATVRRHDLAEPVDLSACAVDIVGRRWAASAGALWVSAADGPWTRAWCDPSWQVPFVTLHADVGLVVAMTADGGVIENRTSRSELAAMLCRLSEAPPARGTRE